MGYYHNDGDGLTNFVIGVFLVGFVVWGCWELVDWLWITDVIRSDTRIEPNLILKIDNNVVDTIYEYRSK